MFVKHMDMVMNLYVLSGTILEFVEKVENVFVSSRVGPDIYNFYKILKIVQFFKHLQQYLRKLIPSLGCKKAGFLKKSGPVVLIRLFFTFFKGWPFFGFL